MKIPIDFRLNLVYGNVVLCRYEADYFPASTHFFPQKRFQKSPCVSSPEAQIEDRCLPAFTDGDARLLTCGVL